MRLTVEDAAVSERLKQARKRLGLTYEECAGRLHVPVSTYRNYETKRSKVTVRLGLEFCREFIVNEEWLAVGTFDGFREAWLARHGPNDPPPPDESAIQFLFRHCVDLCSDPVSGTVRPTEGLHSGFSAKLYQRYKELVIRHFYRPRVVFLPSDSGALWVRYLEAMAGSHVRMLQSVGNPEEDESYRRKLAYLQVAVEASEAALRQILFEDGRMTPGFAAFISKLKPMDAPAPENPVDLLRNKEQVASVAGELELLIKTVKEMTAERGARSELARFLGVNRSRVSEWLNSGRFPRAETAFRLQEWVREREKKQKPRSRGNATGAGGPKTKYLHENLEEQAPDGPSSSDPGAPGQTQS